MSKNTLIAPSVLAADFANLQRDIEMINNSEADWFHIDIMDGRFCSKYLIWNAGFTSHFKTCKKNH